MAVVIDKNTCIGCGACIEVCPVEALTMVDDKSVVDPDKCIDCGACVDTCPVGAMTL
ncbi:MAG: 4Fe-4S binding protein [Candidatus Cloacimonetes bacterium]|nr:4Fe-4S binding protein [Candidatus Cloacimonadota bacterium]